MSDILEISQCNIAQTIGEANRFLFHVMLVHITTCMIEGKKEFFGPELFRTLVITSLAIVMYHLFFRKIIEPKIEKMKLICYDDLERTAKKKKLYKEYGTESSRSSKHTRLSSSIQRTKSEQENESEIETEYKYEPEIETEEITLDGTRIRSNIGQNLVSSRNRPDIEQNLISSRNRPEVTSFRDRKKPNTPRNYSKEQQILRY